MLFEPVWIDDGLGHPLGARSRLRAMGMMLFSEHKASVV